MKDNIFFSIENKSNLTETEKEQVLNINFENLKKNGGQLSQEGILPYDHVVLIKHNEKVIGYTLLKESFCFNDDIYVMQIAVEKKYQQFGIGSAMYNYIYQHSNGYKFFTAKVNFNNKSSQKFHEKNKFSVFGKTNISYVYARSVKKRIKLKLIDGQKEYFKLKFNDEFTM